MITRCDCSEFEIKVVVEHPLITEMAEKGKTKKKFASYALL